MCFIGSHNDSAPRQVHDTDLLTLQELDEIAKARYGA
jgi:hypothetical protein